MRYKELRTVLDEAAELDGKKRLGVRQKDRRAKLAAELGQVKQPDPTPRRAPTGPDSAGRLGGDFQGNVYALHSGKAASMRTMRRDKGFGRIQYMRSRIQRMARKRRTGGVK